MEEYKKGEFCEAIGCEIRSEWKKTGKDVSELKKMCKEKCPKTAYDFHDWLIEHGFSIIKE